MIRLLAATLFASVFGLTAAEAGERTRLGYGMVITNDYIGDGRDRQRTGSVQSSRVWGPEWTGALPQGFGELIEMRLGFAILAPGNLRRPAAGDRPYAGAIAVGAHTHFKYSQLDMTVGGDLVITGPDNGLGNFQRAVHDITDSRKPSDATLDNQIGNGVHPTLVMEAGRNLSLGRHSMLRPFVEGRAGDETLVRTGFDFTFGTLGHDALLVRDATTGHRYAAVQGSDTLGLSFLVGADAAYVSDSIYLPEDRGLTLTDSRDRVRAGIRWQGDSVSGFYGLTWLGKEYETQADDQLVGAFQINFSF